MITSNIGGPGSGVSDLALSAPETLVPGHDLGLVGLHGEGHIRPDSLLYYGVDPALWPSAGASGQTAVFARSCGVVVGMIVVHDQSGIVLWSEVTTRYRRQGVGWRLYLAMLAHRGAAGLRNGCLKGVASKAVWWRLMNTPGIQVVRESDGGFLATLVAPGAQEECDASTGR